MDQISSFPRKMESNLKIRAAAITSQQSQRERTQGVIVGSTTLRRDSHHLIVRQRTPLTTAQRLIKRHALFNESMAIFINPERVRPRSGVSLRRLFPVIHRQPQLQPLT